MNIGFWNVRCLRTKIEELQFVIRKHNIDILTVQESWEKDNDEFNFKGYTWFGKKHISDNKRGFKGTGFLVKNYLVDQTEFTYNNLSNNVCWLKVQKHKSKKHLILGRFICPPKIQIKT